MENDKPRQAYYTFAHQALPEVFFSDPLLMIKTLQENGAAFLRYIWNKTEQYADAVEEGNSELIAVELSKINEMDMALVTLPLPQKRTEAYFIAMLAGVGGLRPRYITLEYGLDLNERPYTVLGEWTEDNLHVNHGVGPQADTAEFLKAVKALLLANKS